MYRISSLLLAWLVPVSLAHAVDNFLVNDIRVEGLQRISPGTVFNYLPVKVGDILSDGSARDAIQALFKTGLFQDVRLERNENVLVVVVVERPSIDSIQINGVKDIDDKSLTKSLKDLGLSEGRVFNSSLLDRADQELKRQYYSRGRYGAVVKTTVTPLERNRVAIRIDVTEGEVSRIRAITIVGNKIYPEKELLGRFELTSPTLVSFMTKSDQYSKQQLSADLESLRSFYQNQGYLDFAVNSTQVSITPDRKDIYLTINMTEGRRFTVNEVKVAGKLVVPEAELRKLINIKKGDVFSRQEVTDSSKRISDRLGNDGYAFANVNPVPDINRELGTVSFTFFVDPGQRVYVRRVNITGNLATNDEVLRRELRQFEGAWFSTEKVQRSKQRLTRLGFFEDVNVETPPVPGVPDQVDLNVTVKERLVNNFMAGIGYSSADGFLVNASVSFKNLMGTGRELVFVGDNSKVNRHLNLSYIEPYFTPSGVSQTLSFNSNRTNAAAANLAAYSTDTYSLGLTYGVPLSEKHSFSIGFGYESVNIEVPLKVSDCDALPPTNQPGVCNSAAFHYVYGYPENNTNKLRGGYGDTNNAFKLNFGIGYDTIDDVILPSRGVSLRLSSENTLPGSDLYYYRVSASATGYYPLAKNLVYKVKGSVDYGSGFAETKDYPFYKNFYAGGSGSVRGYISRSLGPKDVDGPDDTLPVGGSKRVLGNTELIFPFPGMSDNKAMRLALFVDAGMVYAQDQPVDLGDLRYSAGLALNWFSPLGPLSISYGFALNKKPDDRTEALQFTIGTSFR
jgi:outer membrane protein insertion porin family